MGKLRMYEPWGYIEENNYQGSEIIHENDLDGFFAEVSYNKDDNKIHFGNKDGEEVGSLDVSEFEKSDKIVERAWYEDGKIYIKFTNGDVVTIDVAELIDEKEFKDGLIVNSGVVSVLIDSSSDSFLTVSSNGVKLSGVQAEIDRLDGRIDDEITRATTEEQRIDAKLDQEIQNRIDDVDEEETRAKDAEQTLTTNLSNEITRATQTEQQLNSRIDLVNDELDSEESAREAADLILNNKIDGETSRATSAETALHSLIEDEGRRAQDAEIALDGKIDASISAVTEDIDAEVEARKDEAVASAEYVSADKKIYLKNANDTTISEIDTTDFVKDGMIDDVKIENGKLVIVFNTDSGKESIEIPLTDIFDPSNYYTKAETDELIASEATARESGDTALEGEISDLTDIVATKANTSDVNDALALKADKTEIPTDFYTKGEVDSKDVELQGAIDNETARAISAETDLEIALSGKADADVVYTQEEVDALILAKETEIYNLTKLVGEIGGNVTYNYPNDLGTSLTSLLSNNGTVKLGEDATITRFGPGITAKNKVKLNLNNHNITSTAAGSYGAIMSRGTQEITIYGKGTIDAGTGICIEANGKDSIINLTGSTSVYQNDRSGGELIYCYAGTINIVNGIFKNLGDNKAYMLNCYDANYQNGTAKIIVTGGKFYDFNPADNNSEGEHTNFVADGYHVEISTDGDSTVYTVKKDA